MDNFPHVVPTAWKLLAIIRRDTPAVTYLECSKQLGVSLNTIMHWVRKPLYQSYENWLIHRTYEATPLEVKRAVADVKSDIDEFAQEMLDRLKGIVETTNDDKLVAQIGFDMLDRAGYEAPRREAQRPIHLVLTPETLAILARRNREIADTSVVVGEVVDTTQSPVQSPA